MAPAAPSHRARILITSGTQRADVEQWYPPGRWRGPDDQGEEGRATEMANVHDVAAAILERQGAMSAMKLEKLAYYSQAWHLVWDDEPLFEDRIEAWANGPVSPALYDKHRGQFSVGSWPAGDSDRLQPNEIETIDVVLDTYGHMTAPALSELTHREDPWLDARHGLRPGQRSNREITHAAMAEYYGSLYDDIAEPVDN